MPEQKHIIWSNIDLDLDDWYDDLHEEYPALGEEGLGVVVGGVLLAGLYALFNTTIIPTLTTKITQMFSYSGT